TVSVTPRACASSTTRCVMSSTGSVVTAIAVRPRVSPTNASAAAMPGARVAGTTTLPSTLVGNVRANHSPATPGSAATSPPGGSAAQTSETARAGSRGTDATKQPGSA